jgi:hypothetical protein
MRCPRNRRFLVVGRSMLRQAKRNSVQVMHCTQISNEGTSPPTGEDRTGCPHFVQLSTDFLRVNILVSER